jgi:N-acetylglutamate synthase-like GNAT family acetyltransferase
MAELIVREAYEGDEAALRKIVEAATRELRRTYRPRDSRPPCGGAPSGVLVAVEENVVVGTAEYIRKQDQIYVQGIAVHPEYRSRGVCRALVNSVEEIAKAEKLRALALCAIEETGNAEIFKNLGFDVVRRAIAPNHVSPLGGPVTQLDMERKIA